ncbi:hypothetical protein [Aureibaculum marinum]|nr:hypothetical protein [Aureibaculum marinum]
MATTIKIKTKKSKLKEHLANQYKRMVNNSNDDKKLAKTWPLDFNPFVSNKKGCPESWAVFSMNH